MLSSSTYKFYFQMLPNEFVYGLCGIKPSAFAFG